MAAVGAGSADYAEPMSFRGLACHDNLDGLLDHVQSRFFGIGFADRLFALAVAR
jgi:hypothetical protein